MNEPSTRRRNKILCNSSSPALGILPLWGKSKFSRMGENLCSKLYRLASLTKTRFSKKEDHSRICFFKKKTEWFSVDMIIHLLNISLIPIFRSTYFARGSPLPLTVYTKTRGIVGKIGNIVGPDRWKTRFCQQWESPELSSLLHPVSPHVLTTNRSPKTARLPL